MSSRWWSDPLPASTARWSSPARTGAARSIGAYDISRRAGVSPWNWWADVPVRTTGGPVRAPGRRIDAPLVKYRAIFFNDEDPSLKGWATATYGGLNHKFYGQVFELILRLKGNMIWPAMWGKAFYDDDAENSPTAERYGIVIGTSHHEPLMRAHVEWERYGKGAWDYTTNATLPARILARPGSRARRAASIW